MAAQVGLVPVPPETVLDARSASVTGAAGAVIAPAASNPRWPSLTALLVASWIAGATLCVLPIAVGLWQIRTIRRSGLPWRHGRPVVDPLALDAGIRRPVALLLHESRCRTDDMRRPASRDRAARSTSRPGRRRICGARSSTSWSTSAAAIGSRIAWRAWRAPSTGSTRWCGSAWRQLSLEAERACDDAVLASTALSAGADAPTAYADQLVVLAERLSAASQPAAARDGQPRTIWRRGSSRFSTAGSRAAAPGPRQSRSRARWRRCWSRRCRRCGSSPVPSPRRRYRRTRRGSR